MSTQEAPKKPLRADAERNRVRILAAAKAVFAKSGLGASLDDIAAEAGVGVGTVYRRFPDKESLVDALFEEKIDGMTQLATEALEQDDPWEGFEMFMRGVCGSQATDRGLKEVLLHRGRGRERVAQAREKITPIALELMQRAKDDGTLRRDIEQFDIPIINMMIGFAAEATAGISDEYWQRPLQVVLDGLRAQRNEPTPLPGKGLDPDQFELSMAAAMAKRR